MVAVQSQSRPGVTGGWALHDDTERASVMRLGLLSFDCVVLP